MSYLLDTVCHAVWSPNTTNEDCKEEEYRPSKITQSCPSLYKYRQPRIRLILLSQELENNEIKIIFTGFFVPVYTRQL